MLKQVVVIEPRSLLREIVCKSLAAALCVPVIGISSIEEFPAVADDGSLVIFGLGVGAQSDARDIERLASAENSLVVVLSDDEISESVRDALRSGARGVITLNQPLSVVTDAIRLVIAGGVVAPTASLMGARTQVATNFHAATFTPREQEVVDLLRMGKANKAIAFELNICENTVKIHVRHIMRKLNARNRTEVAYLARRG